MSLYLPTATPVILFPKPGSGLDITRGLKIIALEIRTKTFTLFSTKISCAKTIEYEFSIVNEAGSIPCYQNRPIVDAQASSHKLKATSCKEKQMLGCWDSECGNGIQL